ncbi:unnamed protein product [Blepharisma stoltei]|uniref:Transmembrane protein n=1 Tax=Blepharisma stoltei TaxID=1481888 RepID=A0AAU9INK9_9CILI|nr:unnamed protein product [Blepharisma stoltei]
MKDLKNVLVYSGLLILVGFPIWAGIYFGIYFPLENRSYEDAICKVTSIDTYITYQLYYQYKLSVLIDGVYYPGYGCESNAADSIVSDYTNGNVYPYSYSSCIQDKGDSKCLPGQLFLPRWSCSKTHGVPRFAIGNSVKCKWWLHNKDGKTDPSEIKNFGYPKSNHTFIEVLFKDKIYIPKDDYRALWVIPFGFLTVLPILVIMTAFLWEFFKFTPVKRAELKDWIAKVIMRKKIKIPNKFYVMKGPTGKALYRMSPFLLAAMRSKKLESFPKPLVRSVANYIA